MKILFILAALFLISCQPETNSQTRSQAQHNFTNYKDLESQNSTNSENSNTSGEVGSIGKVGSVGSTGNVGSVGSTGNVGSVGSTGNVGSVGSTGSVGTVGSSGNSGTIGSGGLNNQNGNLPVSYYIDENSPKSVLINALKQRRGFVHKWAFECKSGPYKGEISEHPHECHQGDSTLWAGLSCAAATVAGDQYLISRRCSDIEKAQGQNGRWWRGHSKVDKEKPNSFSRDMSLGVFFYVYGRGIFETNINSKNRTKSKLLNWIDWIEHEGNGNTCKTMVGFGNNACKMTRSFGPPLHNMMQKLGVINSSNANYEIIKQLAKDYPYIERYTETMLTPLGFQTHLRSVTILLRKLLGMITDEQYQNLTKLVYNKDKINPWYEFLHKGVTPLLVKKTLDTFCRAKPYEQSQWTLNHNGYYDYFIQRDMKLKRWEVASGHDCSVLINFMLASLENKINLPFSKPEVRCEDKNNYIGDFQGLNICRAAIFQSISRVKCTNEGGVQWAQGSEEYCLLPKSNYWRAKYITKDCPTLHHYAGTYKNMPVCHRDYLESVRYYKCNIEGSEIVPQNSLNHEWCYLHKGTYWQRRKLGPKCPLLNSFTGEFKWNSWPICNGNSRIKKSDCQPPYNTATPTYCLVHKDGWFSKKNYKGECGITYKYASIDKDDKPLCKPLIHLKIKQSKCSSQGGASWNGWCLWDQGDWFKARQLK